MKTLTSAECFRFYNAIKNKLAVEHQRAYIAGLLSETFASLDHAMFNTIDDVAVWCKDNGWTLDEFDGFIDEVTGIHPNVINFQTPIRDPKTWK